MVHAEPSPEPDYDLESTLPPPQLPPPRLPAGPQPLPVASPEPEQEPQPELEASGEPGTAGQQQQSPEPEPEPHPQPQELADVPQLEVEPEASGDTLQQQQAGEHLATGGKRPAPVAPAAYLSCKWPEGAAWASALREELAGLGVVAMEDAANGAKHAAQQQELVRDGGGTFVLLLTPSYYAALCGRAPSASVASSRVVKEVRRRGGPRTFQCGVVP